MARSLSIKNWTIYKITTPDNYIYIGKTDNIKRRKWAHSCLKNQANKFLKESIEKHGWDIHRVDIIENFEANDIYAQGKEMFWIRTYMSNINRWPEMNGLNQTDGGNSIIGYKYNKEAIEKRVSKLRGKPLKKSTKNKISIKLTGVKLPPQRAVNIGKGHMKPMLIYDLNGNFIKECESGRMVYYFLYGKEGTSGHIHEVAKGKRDSYKGYIFKYKDNV